MKTRSKNSTVWLYESVRQLGLTPSEELFYSLLIKMSFYEMKDYCSDVIADCDGRIDWDSIESEFSLTPIVPFWLYQTNKFQQYIEERLGISRRSFYNAINKFKDLGILKIEYAQDIYDPDAEIDCLELFKDEYRDENTISEDKYQGQCYVLNLDFSELSTSKYQYIYLIPSLLKTPKLMYFHSWMFSKYKYWAEQNKKFIESAEHLAEDYGIGFKNFSKMVSDLKALGLISKEYKKEWKVFI